MKSQIVKVFAVVVFSFFVGFQNTVPSQQAYALDAGDLVSFFIDNLTPYGRWSYLEPYGRVWSPNQSVGWRPYTEGSWRYSDEYGWVWDANEEWGNIAYHYGRWTHRDNRWYWIPDAEWGPAWVDWRANDEYVGWAPLPPEAEWKAGDDEWRPQYSYQDYSPYVFIPQRYFTTSNIRNYMVPLERNRYIYDRSTDWTRYRTVNQRVWNEGPPRDVIERHLGHRIEPVRYQPRAIRGRELPAPPLRLRRDNDEMRARYRGPDERHDNERIERERRDQVERERTRNITREDQRQDLLHQDRRQQDLRLNQVRGDEHHREQVREAQRHDRQDEARKNVRVDTGNRNRQSEARQIEARPDDHDRRNQEVRENKRNEGKGQERRAEARPDGEIHAKGDDKAVGNDEKDKDGKPGKHKHAKGKQVKS